MIGICIIAISLAGLLILLDVHLLRKKVEKLESQIKKLQSNNPYNLDL